MAITKAAEEIIENSQYVEILEVEALSKDLKKSLKECGEMSKEEIKALVKQYYQVQDLRKSLTQQIKAAEKDNDEVSKGILMFLQKQLACIEKNINTILEYSCKSTEVGRWLLQIKYIGPVLAAGLLAMLDVEGKEYSSQFISYAGLNDNNRPWLGVEKSKKIIEGIIGNKKSSEISDEDVMNIAVKTQWQYNYLLENAYDEKKGWSKDKLIKASAKVPYNKELKTHMWKVGSSFAWAINKPDSLYGQLLNQRICYEKKKNEDGEYAQQATDILASKNFDKSTTAYQSYIEGKLPEAHLRARAARWVEKIFLSHLFEEMYRVKYNKVPPRYYALEKYGTHNKEIAPEIPYFSV